MDKTRRGVSARITEALLELMARERFEDITVTEVVREAGVARASFYRNFSSTSDVLDAALDDLVDRFKEHALPVITSRDERQWRAFLFRYLYVASERNQRLLLSRTSNANIVFDRLADAAHEISKSYQGCGIEEKYGVSTRLAVVNSVIMRWAIDGREEAPEEIVDYLVGIVLEI